MPTKPGGSAVTKLGVPPPPSPQRTQAPPDQAYRRRKKLKGGRVGVAAAAGFLDTALEYLSDIDPPLVDKRDFYVCMERARAELHTALSILIDQEL